MKDENIVENDPLLNLLNNPNPFQTKRQFLWDYMFWNMLGTSFLNSTTKNILKDSTRLYWLNNSSIEFSDSLLKKLDKLYSSKKKVNELDKEFIEYTFLDNTKKKIYLSEIKIFTDLTNGTGNWFKSPSRLDALYKVIGNSEAGLDAKNINLDFSGKFSVSGKVDPENQFETPLSDPEKQSIIKQTLGKNKLTVSKSMVNISRYVENLGQLKLDDAYMNDFIVIASMYNIPKEIIDAVAKGSTYENQEKAIGRHLSYSIQPKAEDLANGLENYFGYDEKGLNISITYDHLPFMQVFEKDRAEVNNRNAQTLSTLINSGVRPEDAAELLGMEITFNNDGGGD